MPTPRGRDTCLGSEASASASERHGPRATAASRLRVGHRFSSWPARRLLAGLEPVWPFGRDSESDLTNGTLLVNIDSASDADHDPS